VTVTSSTPSGERADVKVGFACNNCCVFCAQGERRDACAAVPQAELEERLVKARTRTRSLVLTGGEPTAYRHLVAVIRRARQLGFDPIQVQTNGRMLSYPRVLDVLLRAGASEFSPALHGSTADLHDSLTRAPGSFAETVAGIRNVVSSRASLVTNSVVVRQNLHDLAALVTLLSSLGVQNMQLALVHPVGTAAERFDEVVPRLPAIVEPLTRACAAARAAGVRLVTEAVPLCFLPGMESLAVEASIPDTTVFDYDGASLDYSAWRAGEGKLHGPPCARCAARGRCEGPWKEYPERFGWDEFQPVR
jgi:MoaA/NifB/PqqE/SkfB family radical SAM enzyme